jgi:YD repeat-containing protein
LWISSSPQQPLSGYGGTLGYGKVKEYTITNEGDTSSITRFYFNEPESAYSYQLPGLPNVPNYTNGLLKEVIYKKNSTIKEREYFTYEIDLDKSKSMYSAHYDPDFYMIAYYINKTEWWKLSSKNTSYFFNTGIISALESYTYNEDNYLLRETNTGISNQDSIVTRILYPGDLGMDNLTENYITGIPVRKEKTKNDQLIEGTSYLHNENGLLTDVYEFEIPASSESSFSGENTIVPDNYVHKKSYMYNSENKLQQQKLMDGTYTCYLWAYDRNYLYPVVKIECGDSITSVNTMQSVISNVVLSGKDDVENIDSDINTLKLVVSSYLESDVNPLVTYYTYKPLVGMTSQTDPNGKTTYYNYDDFGRLEMVKDDNKKIISKYEYHYKRQ